LQEEEQKIKEKMTRPEDREKEVKTEQKIVAEKVG
jgi:hypothetical protein